MDQLSDPVFLAWKGSWEARGFKIVAVDTTSEICIVEETVVAKEILETRIKKSLIKSKFWMSDSPPEKFLLPLSQCSAVVYEGF